MQLAINVHLINKETKEAVKTFMKKDEEYKHGSTFHNLYVEKSEFSNSDFTTQLISEMHQGDHWRNHIELWAEKNSFEVYNPFMMDEKEISSILNSCYQEILKEPSLRLGQVLLNVLDEKTPSPNAQIYHSKDDDFVIKWFYENYLKN